MGIPLVVVKPLDGNHGRGGLNLQDEAEVRAWFPRAKANRGAAAW